MEKTQIPIKVKHILESKGYASTSDCPLARAVKEALNKEKIDVGVTFIFEDMEGIGRIKPGYPHDSFLEDAKTSTMHKNNPDMILRILEFMPYMAI